MVVNFSRVFLLRQLWIVNYYVKNWSNHLSNENIPLPKHCCFCCLQDKTWIKMPKWTRFETLFLWKHQFFCFHYWYYLTKFWRNNWRSIIDLVKRLCYLRVKLCKKFVFVTKQSQTLHGHCSFNKEMRERSHMGQAYKHIPMCFLVLFRYH